MRLGIGVKYLKEIGLLLLVMYDLEEGSGSKEGTTEDGEANGDT